MRLARERALGADQPEQGSQKSSASARKGYEALRRNFEKNIIEVVELRSVRTLGFVNAEDIARKVIALYDQGAFDVCTLFFSRFKSVIAQIPTAAQIIPLVVEARGRECRPDDRPTNTSRKKTRS